MSLATLAGAVTMAVAALITFVFLPARPVNS